MYPKDFEKLIESFEKLPGVGNKTAQRYAFKLLEAEKENILNNSNEISVYKEYDKDVIVEEDVWIGAHVTLLSGVTIGLGSVIGTGCVVRCNVPPYAIFAGNPAKVVGFRFTPEEVIKHEQILYSEEERLPIDVLTKNYKKYFLDHIKGIKDYTSIICR